MIARFEGGPYHGRTVVVHGEYKDFRAMGLEPFFDILPAAPDATHELVAGQYQASGKRKGEFLVFRWDGPKVEAQGLLGCIVDAADDSDTLGDRRVSDSDRRSGHAMGRRSLRGDRRIESRRLGSRRNPTPENREES